MTYLGTGLSPSEYYKFHSNNYSNPHERSIRQLLGKLGPWLNGAVLDIGCGNGLATSGLSKIKTITSFIGVDSSDKLCIRYTNETKYPAIRGCFWNELPKCNSIVACYSLHLCESSRLHDVWYRMQDTGATRLLVITPFKNNPCPPICSFEQIATALATTPDVSKTIYGRVYRVRENT